jgi:pimeloyl-ACP methyl ester carboxylesterase
MSQFVMVHGAWHDAWCWELVAPHLVGRGHRVITMDLPSDDPRASFTDYADVVAAAMPADPDEDVVLVAHSLGGQTAPLVPARRRVDQIVYLCALPPIPGTSFRDQLSAEPGMVNPGYVKGLGSVDDEGRRGWADPALARSFLYGDCDDDVAAEAITRLRPQAQTPYLDPCVLREHPAVPTTYIVCAEDQLVNPDWSRRFATGELNAHLVELAGDHSPFLSRPSELAETLDGVTRA